MLLLALTRSVANSRYELVLRIRATKPRYSSTSVGLQVLRYELPVSIERCRHVEISLNSPRLTATGTGTRATFGSE